MSADKPTSRIFADADLSELIEAYPGPAAAITPDGALIAVNATLAAYRPVGVADWTDALCPNALPLGIGRVTSASLDGDHAVLQWAPLAVGSVGTVLLGIDVTLDANLRAALTESRQRFRDLAELGGDMAWEVDEHGRFTFVTPAASLGLPPSSLLGTEARDLLVVPQTDPAPFNCETAYRDLAVWLRSADGSPICLSMSARAVRDREDKWCGMRGIGTDITERQAREARLATVQQRDTLISRMAQAMRDQPAPRAGLGIMLDLMVRATSADGARLYLVTEDAEPRAIGAVVGSQEPAANHLREAIEQSRAASGPCLVSRDDCHIVALPCRHRPETLGALIVWRFGDARAWLDGELSLMDATTPQIAFALCQVLDQEALKRRAETDPLTGLCNRAAVTDRIARRLNGARVSTGALLYVDLDNFKAVNDTRGHALGDTALRRVAAIFATHLKDADLAGRMGGDEFVLWIDSADHGRAQALAESLVDAGHGLEDLSATADRPLGLSVGIAMSRPSYQEAPERLIERADAAMYVAKRSGKRSGAHGAWTFADGDAPE